MDKIEKYIDDLKKGDSATKRFVAYKLGIIGNYKSFQPLVDALKDSSPYVRSNVCEALGYMGNIGAINHLIHYLEDIDYTVRCAVIEAIGMIAKFNPNAEKVIYEEAIPIIAQALGNEQYLLRHFASDTLAKIGGESVYKVITSTLINGNDYAIEFAIWTIEKLKDTTFEDQLIDMYKNTVNKNIKRAVIKTLETISLDENIFINNGISEKEIEDLFNEEIFDDRLFYEL